MKSNRELIEEAIGNIQEFMKRQTAGSVAHTHASEAVRHLWALDSMITNLTLQAEKILSGKDLTNS